jgi:broad specificity phosphatase PhoE
MRAAPAGSVVVLIRHSLPEIDPARPATEWPLSVEGRRRARELAADLRQYGLQLLASSGECRAVQTAATLGEELHLAVDVVPDLHEHDRANVVGLDRPAFLRAVGQRPIHIVAVPRTAVCCCPAEARPAPDRLAGRGRRLDPWRVATRRR